MTKEALNLNLANDLVRYAELVEDEALISPEEMNCASVMRLAAEALAQPEQAPVAWKNAAIRLGEELSSVGPDGYYNMNAEQWLDWAMDQRPQGNNSLPPQRKPLTDEEIKACLQMTHLNEDVTRLPRGWKEFARAIEAAHGIKE